MGTRRNIITLNGNRYDAVTGELLDDSQSSRAVKKPTSGPSIDGFVSKKQPVHSAREAHHIARQSLKSKTLMRSAVPKPVKKTVNNDSSDVTIKKNIAFDVTREKRSQDVARSSLISKFGTEMKKITQYSPIAVTDHPEQNHKETKSAPVKAHNLTPKPPSNKHSHIENVINKSDSHHNQKTKKPTRRHKIAKKLKISPSLLNVSMVVMTVLVLGGYFAYNNVPNLAMRVASTRSGIPGSMPKYQPNGYALDGPLQYKAGQIIISYGSNSDDRSYSVTEKNSDWNSDALLENHVATSNRSYQTFQEKGKTIYIYDSDSASWVDNGIWYEINGNSSLNTDQVIRIANSL